MDDSGILTNLENETLIENNSLNPSSIATTPSGRHWFLIYLSIRLTPFFVYFVSVFLFNSIPTFKILIITLSIFSEFWLTKNKEGLELVGLRWSHEISEEGADPKWIFYSRRDPFVPDISKLHCFWTVMYAMTILWSIISFLSIITPNFKWIDVFLSLMAMSCEYVNLFCFLQCNQQSSKQADDIARGIMLDNDNVESDREIEPENEAEDENDTQAPTIIHTETTTEKKSRVLDNPRLTLPIRKNKNSDENEKVDLKNKDGNDEEIISLNQEDVPNSTNDE